MPCRCSLLLLAIATAAVLLCRPLFPVAFAAPACELSVAGDGALYSYSLAAPIKGHPHGALSEDGFYKVGVNTTFLWFQLCDLMIFNHDTPSCVACQDCGGPLRCGTMCTALVAIDIGGYYVCKSVGKVSNMTISPIDEGNPQKGVVVKMSSFTAEISCSISVSIFCDRNHVQLPDSVDILGDCDYATTLRHPSGCPKITSLHGTGWGWLATTLFVILCLFGGYLFSGTAYRFYFLGIRGPEAVPNLEFWLSLPKRTTAMFSSLVGKFRRGGSSDGRGAYAPIA